MNKIFSSIILIFVNGILNAQEDCIFDQTTQTDEFIKTIPEFSNYKWDNDKKEARIILNNGEILLAYRGGCVHFGISGTWIIPTHNFKFNDLDYLFEKCIWVAKRLFNDHDYKLLVSSIKNKTYTNLSDKNGTYIIIPHGSYNEFSIAVRMEGDTTEIYIGYYY